MLSENCDVTSHFNGVTIYLFVVVLCCGFFDAKSISKIDSWKKISAILGTHLAIEYQEKLRCMCCLMATRRKCTPALSVTDIQSNLKNQSNQC